MMLELMKSEISYASNYECSIIRDINNKKDTDIIWDKFHKDAKELLLKEPLLEPLLVDAIIKHKRFKDALFYRLATKLGGKLYTHEHWLKIFDVAFGLDDENIHDIESIAINDLFAVNERDPACDSLVTAFLYFKGYKALQTYRIAHVLWQHQRKELALLVQSRCSEVFGVDIHPAAVIGKRIMIDHATGLVVGETAVVGDDCSFLHNVTLGATGKESGNRHPKLGNNVSVGCNASILGNINIGDNCKIGAGSVVLKALDANSTAVGNPAKPIVPKKMKSNAVPIQTVDCCTKVSPFPLLSALYSISNFNKTLNDEVCKSCIHTIGKCNPDSLCECVSVPFSITYKILASILCFILLVFFI
eukprot:gene12352-16566_t